MLAQIDEYVFETNSNISSLVHKLSFPFAKHNRIGNNPLYQKSSSFEEEVTFSGYFVLEKNTSLDKLEEVAKKMQPIFFITKSSNFKVIISDLEIDKSLFLKSGDFIKQGFSITLKRYFK